MNWLGLLLLLNPIFAQELTKEAEAMRNQLKQNCAECHAPPYFGNANKYGNFLTQDIFASKMLGNDVTQTTIYRKVKSGDMPQADLGTYLSDSERKQFLDTLAAWMKSGKPTIEKIDKRETVSLENVLDLCQKDAAQNGQARQVRYFTFTHLYNAGVDKETLDINRQALFKLVNSISWNSNIIKLKAIDPLNLIYKVDFAEVLVSPLKSNQESALRDLDSAYPYSKLPLAFKNSRANFESLKELLSTNVPVYFADWFIATASRPPLYHELAGLPTSLSPLEDQLRVDRDSNIARGLIDRAGFIESGVSNNNRIIERHASVTGAYWISYDFAADGKDPSKNITTNPIGPKGVFNSSSFRSNAQGDLRSAPFELADKVFKQDGGEVIFNLPNGLQAYMLVDKDDIRINQGPIQIVSDLDRADRLVTNGISCMGCHFQGMRLKDDTIAAAFNFQTKDEKLAKLKGVVQKLYGQPSLGSHFEEDRSRFMKAMKKAGVTVTDFDPISRAAQAYEKTVAYSQLQTLLGLNPGQANNLAASLDNKSQQELPFLQGATIGLKRDTLEANFDQLLIGAHGKIEGIRTNDEIVAEAAEQRRLQEQRDEQSRRSSAPRERSYNGCFAAGTKVQTPTGLKNIEDIKIGDSVLSYDVVAKQVLISKVKDTESIDIDGAVEIAGAFGSLYATINHRIFSVKDDAFIQSVKMKPQDVIYVSVNGQVEKQAVRDTRFLTFEKGHQKFYSFEVTNKFDDYPHKNFFANGVLVHNGVIGLGKIY